MNSSVTAKIWCFHCFTIDMFFYLISLVLSCFSITPRINTPFPNKYGWLVFHSRLNRPNILLRWKYISSVTWHCVWGGNESSLAIAAEHSWKRYGKSHFKTNLFVFQWYNVFLTLTPYLTTPPHVVSDDQNRVFCHVRFLIPLRSFVANS